MNLSNLERDYANMQKVPTHCHPLLVKSIEEKYLKGFYVIAHVMLSNPSLLLLQHLRKEFTSGAFRYEVEPELLSLFNAASIDTTHLPVHVKDQLAFTLLSDSEAIPWIDLTKETLHHFLQTTTDPENLRLGLIAATWIKETDPLLNCMPHFLDSLP